MVDNVIILAGGSGTRLWPASTNARPKQFLDPGVGKSLLQLTIERASATGTEGRIIIVTHRSQAAAIYRDLERIGELRRRVVVLGEPLMRNTAPAIALALGYLASVGAENGTSLLLSSDHLITPVDAFAADVERADQLARADRIVTFGIQPTRAETGYGYIEVGDPLPPGRTVRAFREKPDAATAAHYLAAGGYYWNSGMFVFRNQLLAAELGRFEPAVHELFVAVSALAASSLADEECEPSLPGLYERTPKISIDYAVMERSDRTAVVESTFQWNDVGSWDEMAQLAEAGVIGSGKLNSLSAAAFSIEGRGNYVYADQPVVLCGVDNIAVIVQNGRVLVARRGRGQLVKDAVELIAATGLHDLL